jgi:signal transduction histidine kinase
VLFDRFHVGRDTTAGSPADEADEVAGIGLGLYLAKSVVEQMGGAIAVESEVGRGSTFTVSLPVWSSRVPAAGIEEESDGEAVTGRR